MVSPDILGFAGGVLCAASFVPQIVKLYHIKSAVEISLLFNILLLVGMLCWLGYGILFQLFPVILSNAAGVTLVAILLAAKLKYGR
ncbi:MAG: hypothetical protein CO103_02870 [Chloroflexi bacterium CG_4_9_14_3_um_filter_45_9]|nr:MAG: hypothetical protein AUK00_05665 [Dehalococcoidia bacterium CG2_30_46_9]PIU23220.1 MAG: hypothetical protein COT13_04205 [Chloroflexi bacterium CG08_land_8_20_14_0_20_45_12]PIX27026.1 MAG: hypothetical protein COZ67_04535 [Chloroflexi bacterium CG_4_8_14_3_um_filter_45_15]PJB50249.1 MAG: hypothetical protein CO103_02870 [Chloroflexi bacterium CG_4_9_14_3_um_filter_45_9]